MVGYGKANEEPLVWELDGVRRSGQNKISDIRYDKDRPFRMYKIMADFGQDAKTNASTFYGDSGGPLFNQAGELIGITQSGHATMFGWDARFVDLTSFGAKSYIDDQLAGTIKSIDISTVAPAVCNPAAMPAAIELKQPSVVADFISYTEEYNSHVVIRGEDDNLFVSGK